MRDNLIAKLKRGDELFPGIVGYEEHRDAASDQRDSLAPQFHPARIARTSQGARLLRALTTMLDAYSPSIEGCEIHDNPYHPICKNVPRLGSRR